MSKSINDLELFHSGKVRETYLIPGYPNLILVIATDRISTHNEKHLSEVPEKGSILTALTHYWMKKLEEAGISTHLVAYGYEVLKYVKIPTELLPQAIIVKKLEMIPLEFIYRSYLTGSLWSKFYSKGLVNPYGIILPAGLKLMSKFAENILTPTEKSATDDPTDTGSVISKHRKACILTNAVYKIGQEHLRSVGLEMVDSKFEVGFDSEDRICLGDECLTPDSSRFARPGDIVLGENPPWLDKQSVRDEVERVYPDGENVKPMTFSKEVLAQTKSNYHELFEMITGRSFHSYYIYNNSIK